MEQNISMQKLKQQRATPAEKFVLDTIKSAKASKPDECGDVRWDKDGKGLFKQVFKFGYLWVSYKIIWLVLEKEYGLDYNEIQQLIRNVMYKYTNNGQLTPLFSRLINNSQMYKYTNNGQLTPLLGKDGSS